MTSPVSNSKRTCVLILGMHRSGTSALTKLINILGVSLPNNVLGAGDGNDSGHWEPKNLVDINDRILAELNTSWDSWGHADTSKLSHDRRLFYKSEICREILNEYGNEPIFVIKDPRICRLGSIYIEALEEMDLDLKVVVPFRSPSEVAASLAKRNEIDLIISHMSWLRHILDAEFVSRDLPRLFYSYEQILSDWTPVFEGLTTQLDLKIKKPTKATQKKIEDFLNPDLRHFSSDIDLPKSSTGLSHWVLNTYAALKKLTLDPNDASALKKLDQIQRQFELSADVISPSYDKLKRKISDVQNINAELNAANIAISSRNESIQKDLENIQEKSKTHIKNIEAELTIQKSKNSELIAVQASLENAQQSFQNKILEQQEAIAILQKGNLDQHNALTEQQKTIDNLNNNNSKQHEIILQHQKTIDEHEANIAELSQSVENLSNENGAQQKTIIEQTKAIEEYDSDIADLRQSVEKLNNNNAEQHKMILEQNTIINNHENTIAHQEDAVQELHVQNDLLTRTKAELENSLSWKMTKPFRSAAKIKSRLTEHKYKNALKNSNLFDPSWYKTTYPDVQNSKLDPLTHFLRFGAQEARNPSSAFDTKSYLHKNPDVTKSGINPLLHFVLHGEKENREFLSVGSKFELQEASQKLFLSASPIQLKLTSFNQLNSSVQHVSGPHWESTGNDPYFVFEPEDGVLKSGHYLMTLELGPDDHPPSSARIYVNYGAGFCEEDGSTLSFFKHNDCWSASFELKKPVTEIRFDPTHETGPLSIGHFQLKRVTRQSLSLLLASNLIKNRIKSPRDIVVTAGKFGRSIKNGGIKQLYEDLEITTKLESKTTGYQSWIDQFDSLKPKDVDAIKRHISRFASTPKISVVVPVYNPPIELLKLAIESVIGQYYTNWELCLANDKSTDPLVAETLDAYAEADSRIKVIHREENGHISNATNSALELVKSDWVALLDHDDLLTPHALYHMALAIQENPNGRLFYSDEDKINMDSVRHDPHFKPDFNIDLFYSYNMISHFGMYHKSIVDKIGGFRVGYEGAQDYDLALRYWEQIKTDQIIHIPHILYHWRVVPGSTAQGSDEKPYAMIAGEKALADHIERMNMSAKASSTAIGYKVSYKINEPAPIVSLIIPTRNAHGLVKQAVDSIFELTTYPNYEIVLVDNGSDDPDSLAYFEELKKDSRVTVIRDDSPFNYSALNNNAVAKCRGSVIALVNNDISVISPHWLDEMVSLAIQPNVGAVGAMLYYPNDTIQHAGVAIGIGGVAGHLHIGFERGAYGYFSRAAQRQTLTAVTAACLVITREHFEQVGGLNEKDLTVAFNDVDFCLKLHSKGLRNIWTPYAELYHHESASRGSEDSPEKKARFEKEALYMMSNWANIIAHDPAYSPNLTLNDSNFSFAFPPRVRKPWLTPQKPATPRKANRSTSH